MKRLLLPSIYRGESEFELVGREFHHLIHVLRFTTGDTLKATDISGKLYSVTISRVGKDRALLTLTSEASDDNDRTDIRLVQALPKGKAMDLVVRQATEAGVSRIIPVTSRYSVVKLDDESDEDKKVKRWNAVALEALKQSGMRRLPRIDPPIRLHDLSFEEDSIRLLLHIPAGSKTKTVPLHTALSQDRKIIYIGVGPEGGFSDDEAEMLVERGCVPVSLGENILRVETAALYAVAAVNMIVLEKGVWRTM